MVMTSNYVFTYAVAPGPASCTVALWHDLRAMPASSQQFCTVKMHVRSCHWLTTTTMETPAAKTMAIQGIHGNIRGALIILEQ
ncbi:unnamed protein product [Taenia asiatica]|uniref:Secreted protein n=1 Tax=Taenia asiatica TaxID=60517 RepID=A0A0R3VVU6_TAEAS|nr:unnamed protein product [Taenia asiatica]